MHARRSAAAAVATLLLAACGGASTTAQSPTGPASTNPAPTLPSLDGSQPAATSPSPMPEREPTGGTSASVLPDLVVDDVGAGAKVNLATLAPAPQPLLVWFWAPH